MSYVNTAFYYFSYSQSSLNSFLAILRFNFPSQAEWVLSIRRLKRNVCVFIKAENVFTLKTLKTCIRPILSQLFNANISISEIKIKIVEYFILFTKVFQKLRFRLGFKIMFLSKVKYRSTSDTLKVGRCL